MAPLHPTAENFKDIHYSYEYVDFVKAYLKNIYIKTNEKDTRDALDALDALDSNPCFEEAKRASHFIVTWEHEQKVSHERSDEFAEIFDCFKTDNWFEDTISEEDLYHHMNSGCTPEEYIHINMCISMYYYSFNDEALRSSQPSDYIENVLNSFRFKETYLSIMKDAYEKYHNDFYTVLVNIFLHARSVAVEMRNNWDDDDDDDNISLLDEHPIE